MATPRNNLKLEAYTPAVKLNGGLYTELPIQTTSDITAANITSITTDLALTGTLSVDGASTLNATTLTTGDLTLTDGDIILTANSSLISFTGTGANGGVLRNLKNATASALSGTQRDIEISIAGTPYYFTVFPTKA